MVYYCIFWHVDTVDSSVISCTYPLIFRLMILMSGFHRIKYVLMFKLLVFFCCSFSELRGSCIPHETSSLAPGRTFPGLLEGEGIDEKRD